MAPRAFDLSAFAPAATVEVTFKRGGTIVFPGDPSTDDVARMLRLEQEIEVAESVELADLLDQGKDLLAKMAREVDPAQDVKAVEIGGSELCIVFALLLHGETVATAVAAALTVDPDEDEDRERDGDPAEGGAPFGPETSARLPSA